jgi:hypothetical protein
MNATQDSLGSIEGASCWQHCCGHLNHTKAAMTMQHQSTLMPDMQGAPGLTEHYKLIDPSDKQPAKGSHIFDVSKRQSIMTHSCMQPPLPLCQS